MSETLKNISLKLSKSKCFIDGITFYEVSNPNHINALIENKEFEFNFKNKYNQLKAEGLYKNVIDQLKAYNNQYNSKNKLFEVVYKKSSNHKYGRVFPVKALGFTSFSRKIRNTLMYENYIDIDLKNAQIEIIYNIAKSNNINLKYIKKYCEKRDEILQNVMTEYSVNKKQAKELFLTLGFFGSFDSWKEHNKIKNTNSIKFIDKYIDDIKTFYKAIKKENEKLYETAKKQKPSNIKGSFLSLYLQEWETRIIDTVIYYLYHKTSILDYNEKKVLTYEFDGIKLLKSSVNKYGLDKLISDIEKVIYDELGFIMKFEEKPIDDFVIINYDKNINKEDEIIEKGVWDDKQATEKLFKLYPYWKYCLGSLYVFDKNNGLWTTNISIQRKVIQLYEDDLRILTTDIHGKPILTKKSYGNCLSKMDIIITLIKSECVDDNWLVRDGNSSLKMLLFNNGYIDLKNEFKFYDKETYGFNPNILFFEKIQRDFKPFDEKKMEYVNSIKDRFFCNILGENLGNYYITQLSRGLMGDIMKKILFSLGTTDCGKSILSYALRKSLDGYCDDFNAENLFHTKNTADEGAKLRWCLLLRNKRIITSNEMKTNTTINGNMLKKISSGGDGLKGRVHQGLETSFVPHFLTICMANDLPKISPYDVAVDNRVRVISYKKQFVDVVEDEETQLLKDYNITDEINTVEFQDAFLMMLIQAYVNYRENGEIEPDEVLNGKKEWIEETGDMMDTFLQDFEMTNNKEDFVSCSTVKMWLDNKQLGISSSKIAIEIKKYSEKNKFENVYNKQKKVDGKNITVWFGVKEL